MRAGPLPGQNTLFPFPSCPWGLPLSGLGVEVGGSEWGGEHLLAMGGLAAGLSQCGWLGADRTREGPSSRLAEGGTFQKPVISATHAHWSLGGQRRGWRGRGVGSAQGAGTDIVTEHALITWLSCTDDVPAHALMTWLIGH